MRTLVAVLVLPLLLVSLSEAQRKTKVKPKKAELAIKAGDLSEAYSDNLVAADKRYKGKTIAVTGKILAIARMEKSSSVSVTLDTGSATTPIFTYFQKDQQALLLKVKKGDSVEITGHCAGMQRDKKVWITRCHGLKKAEE